MTLLERNGGILRRVEALQPAADRCREVLARGKREQLLAGVDARGVPYDPPSPATLGRRGPGTILVPDGEASALIARYTVTATVGPGRIELSAGWPGLDWVQYHATGTRRMPRRDPTGFRAEDRAANLDALSRWTHGSSR